MMTTTEAIGPDRLALALGEMITVEDLDLRKGLDQPLVIRLKVNSRERGRLRKAGLVTESRPVY